MGFTDWRVGLDYWPTSYEGVQIESFKEAKFEIIDTGLIVVDMQRYWLDPDGPTGFQLKNDYADIFEYFYSRVKDTVIPSLSNVLEVYRRLELPIIHLTYGPARSDAKDLVAPLQKRISCNGSRSNRSLLQVGSEWHSIVEELTPRPDEMVLNKTSASPFNSTGIDQLLRNLGLRQLLVGGFATNGCVELTARDAADRGYETFLLEDGCATYTEEAQFPVFRTFERTSGRVIESEDVLPFS